MVYSIGYRRPASVKTTTGSSLVAVEKKRSTDASITSTSQQSGMSHGIPDVLSFDRIVSGGTCPPCTLREFLNYLKYIELSAENLQFFLWCRDYAKRFDALPEKEKTLSPEWTVTQAEAEALAAKSQGRKNKTSPEAVAAFNGTDFADGSKVKETEQISPFGDSPVRTPSEHSKHDTMDAASDGSVSEWRKSITTSTIDHCRATEDAFESVGQKIHPFSVQPYREEVSRIIAIYVADGASRQLNLSSRERTALLHALASTTHPSAFRDIMKNVEWSLRCQSHPNFIRWTICNGNRPRVAFARGLGVFLVLAGVLIGTLLTLSHVPRGYRALSALFLLPGISTLIAACKGMCVVLHGMHHRHVRPWELFTSDDEPEVLALEADGCELKTNSFEDEPWVARYDQRNIIRKIFDREVWIEEPAMRQIQDTIFLQSVLGTVLATAILLAVFLSVPRGNFF